MVTMWSPQLLAFMWCVNELMEKRIPVMLLRVIEHWFSIGNTCVKWGTYFSHSFKLLCGVRQGGVLSLYLFAVYIDSVYQKAAATRTGCYFKGICFSILMYADDIILLAPSVSALQHQIRRRLWKWTPVFWYVYQRQQITLYHGWLASCTALS